MCSERLTARWYSFSVRKRQRENRSPRKWFTFTALVHPRPWRGNGQAKAELLGRPDRYQGLSPERSDKGSIVSVVFCRQILVIRNAAVCERPVEACARRSRELATEFKKAAMFSFSIALSLRKLATQSAVTSLRVAGFEPPLDERVSLGQHSRAPSGDGRRRNHGDRAKADFSLAFPDSQCSGVCHFKMLRSILQISFCTLKTYLTSIDSRINPPIQFCSAGAWPATEEVAESRCMQKFVHDLTTSDLTTSRPHDLTTSRPHERRTDPFDLEGGRLVDRLIHFPNKRWAWERQRLSGGRPGSSSG